MRRILQLYFIIYIFQADEMPTTTTMETGMKQQKSVDDDGTEKRQRFEGLNCRECQLTRHCLVSFAIAVCMYVCGCTCETEKKGWRVSATRSE